MVDKLRVIDLLDEYVESLGGVSLTPEARRACRIGFEEGMAWLRTKTGSRLGKFFYDSRSYKELLLSSHEFVTKRLKRLGFREETRDYYRHGFEKGLSEMLTFRGASEEN